MRLRWLGADHTVIAVNGLRRQALRASCGHRTFRCANPVIRTFLSQTSECSLRCAVFLHGWSQVCTEPRGASQNPTACVAADSESVGRSRNNRMPKEYSNNRRSEILRAAEKLVSTKGLNGVTTQQISREVGCSEGALYVHFKGRLELSGNARRIPAGCAAVTPSAGRQGR
jgi:hypothetical protein